MNVVFYNFKKCSNETKIPSSGTTIGVNLKENSSILRPTLILSFNGSWSYNYFHIPDFNRYYFVDNVTFLGNSLYEIQGSSDPMASFRTDILGSVQYILRAASGYDTDIPDMMYPAKGGRKVIYHGDAVAPAIPNYNSGTFILGAIGENDGAAGVPVTYYALDFVAMGALNDYLFDSANYGSMISDDIVKAFFNPMDYIVSCVYFPYAIATAQWQDSDIYFGWFKTDGINAKKLGDYKYTDTGLSFEFPIEKPYNDYRKLNPWTQYQLWCIDQFIDLPPEKLYNYSTLNVSVELDLVVGLANCEVYARNPGDAQSRAVVARTSCQFGCPVSMAQLRQDWQGVIQNAASSVGSLFSLNIGSTVQGVVDAVNCFLPDPSTRGTNGALGSAFWNKYMELRCYYVDTTELNTNRLGRPVCKTDTISNYSGYCLCREAEVELTGAYASEIEAVTGFMNGGFYVN